jgi:hypothetical protein
MAEGDKFERRVRGPWRKVYRLGKGGAQVALVVDAVMTAASEGLRKDLACNSLGQIVSALQSAAQTSWLQKQSTAPVLTSALSGLCAELDGIEQTEFGSVGVHLASDAALSVFAKLDANPRYLTKKQIQDAFADEFVWRILENRCMSHVREGIAAVAEHTSKQQEQWEADLRSTLRGQSLKLLNQMVRGDGSLAVARAPRRLTSKMPTTHAILNQPLQNIARR